jgi:phosphohistidine phosphatase SixA
MELINDISKIDTSDHCYAIYIRHGERDFIPVGEKGEDIELNESGIQKSFEYGQSLKQHRVNKIYSSPVKRCIQTADAIRKGLDINIQTEYSELLGIKGAFVKDENTLCQEILSLEECYIKLINHKPVARKVDISVGAALLTEYFLKYTEEKGISLFISHDMYIALYAHEIFKLTYHPSGKWIEFLNGLIIKTK